jgi:hypothetical protein
VDQDHRAALRQRVDDLGREAADIVAAQVIDDL